MQYGNAVKANFNIPVYVDQKIKEAGAYPGFYNGVSISINNIDVGITLDHLLGISKSLQHI